jgi:flagellar biosynthesis protein FlhF
MKIRRYMGSNMQEVLLKVKMDLGNDAVKLNTRKVKRQGFFKFLKPSLVEILASLEEEEDEAKKMVAENTKVNELENKVKSMESMLDKIYSQLSNKDIKNESVSKNESKIYDILIANMRQNDIEEEVIKKVVESLKEKGIDEISNVNEVFSMFQKEIIRMLGQISTINLDGKKPKVIMFLGPTGVGKTTTLAKIAANFMIRENKKVGLITADTYRIAAVEQLKTYSEIMGAPVSIIYSPNEIKAAIEKHKDDDLVLIDTPGKSHKNKKHFDEIKDLVYQANPDEIYLLISASTNIKDCKEIIKAYNFIEKYNLIFTKIDETESLGIVMNIANMTGKKLSYFTIGQSVPDDIEMINVDKLSKRLLGKG